jgi:hypothetical protein
MPIATPIRMTEETPDRPALFLAVALGANPWKRGFTTGAAQRPRERNVPARNLAAGQEEIRKAKERFGLPADAPGIRCDEAGRDSFWLHRWRMSQGGPTAWSTRPALQSSVVTGGRRPIGSRCSSCSPCSCATLRGHGRCGGSSGAPVWRQKTAGSGIAPARPRNGSGRGSSTASKGYSRRMAWGCPPAGTSHSSGRTSACGTAPRSWRDSTTVAGRRGHRGWRCRSAVPHGKPNAAPGSRRRRMP